jgi:hypothetical protein
MESFVSPTNEKNQVLKSSPVVIFAGLVLS